jgi:hypothetical protein
MAVDTDHVDEWEGDAEDPQDDMGDIRQPFFDQFPTVRDAVRTAESGEPVVWSDDIGYGPMTMRHTVKISPDGRIVEQAVFLDPILDDMIYAAWLQSLDRDRATTFFAAPGPASPGIENRLSACSLTFGGPSVTPVGSPR